MVLLFTVESTDTSLTINGYATNIELITLKRIKIFSVDLSMDTSLTSQQLQHEDINGYVTKIPTDTSQRYQRILHRDTNE